MIQLDCWNWTSNPCLCSTNRTQSPYNNIATIWRWASSVVCSLAIIGNLLSVTVVFRERKLHNPSGFLIAALASSEMSIGLILNCYAFVIQALRCAVFDQLCIIIGYLSTGFAGYSQMIVALIAIDRCLSIKSPFHYHLYVTNWRLFWLLLAMLGFTLILASFPLMGLESIGLGKYQYVPFMSNCWLDIVDGRKNSFFLILIYGFMIAVILILIICYSIIFMEANRMHRIRQQVQPTRYRRKFHRRKVARTTMLMIIIFLILTVPALVIALMTIKENQLIASDLTYYLIIYWGLHIRIVFNPLLFGFSHRDFRHSYYKLFLCRPRSWNDQIYDMSSMTSFNK